MEDKVSHEIKIIAQGHMDIIRRCLKLACLKD